MVGRWVSFWERPIFRGYVKLRGSIKKCTRNMMWASQPSTKIELKLAKGHVFWIVPTHPPKKKYLVYLMRMTWDFISILKFHIWSADLFFCFFCLFLLHLLCCCLGGFKNMVFGSLTPILCLGNLYFMNAHTLSCKKKSVHLYRSTPMKFNISWVPPNTGKPVDSKVNIELLSKQWVDYRSFTHSCRVLANPQLIYYKSLLYLVVEPPISKMRPQNRSKIPHHLWRPREFFIFESLPSFFGINLLVKFRDKCVYP